MKRNAMNWLGRPFVGVFLLSLILVFAVSCDENNASSEVGEYIPEAPDYTDDTMWFTQENDATGQGADVFYLVSTWEVDWETAERTYQVMLATYKELDYQPEIVPCLPPKERAQWIVRRLAQK